jgi:CheY-like chemotaxis protein
MARRAVTLCLVEFLDRPVLVVDDNEDDIGLTTLLVRKAGALDIPAFLTTQGACGYLGSIKGKILSRPPLAMVLDVKMPGMSGLDLLRWVRAQPEFNALPIVMWSTSDDPRDLRTAAELRAQCYVAKYPNVPALKEILAEAAGYPGTQEPLRFFKVPSNLLLGRDALPDLAVA